ncbi:hypothetical protein PVK06_028635 [Gossypium arboreum]|uniref:SWIM-type domain-containing protein n=1 Tax=Gossypium arboreum TaxID=29729 RepID=A0ABR0P3T9_GOSAR|nr:hypothetical protein PVK06_028635 [Gossypium arboreum]
MLAVLRSVNEEGADYLCNIPFEQWTQAYDGGLQYSHMTSNLAECINSVLKGMHHLPTTTVVRESYFRLATLFSKRAASYKGQMQGGHVWCAKVLQEIKKAKARANTMDIVCHDHDNLWFLVTEFDRPNQGIIGKQYHVHLRNKTCDCGVFGALRYLCAHVIAACQNLRLDPTTYVDQVYKIEYMYNVWRHVFPLIRDERDLVMGVGRMTHLDKIMNAEVFASPMVEVFESHKAIGNGKKKSFPTEHRTIPHATVAY